ncbi:HET domain containing protein [Hyaloscypha variabilis]
MANWHRESCKHPDVYPADDSCYCSSCDTLAPLDQVVPDEAGFVPTLPELPADRKLHLTWPESVEFWNGQDIYISPKAAEGESLKAVGTYQCCAGVDKFPQQISSAAPKLKEIYKTLDTTDQIRLLLLSKGNFNDPIHGTLMIARLSNDTEFRALSYTWADAIGDDSRSQVIFLGPRWNMFMVTANCKAALRRLRRKDDDCMVWVDAICIDQGNDFERNHQVGLMRRIYSAASEVFVYLGEPCSLSNEGFERLMWAKKDQPIDEKGRRSLSDLFDMRYFYRIWVIQEVANAKLATINSGGKTMGWSILEEQRLKTLDILDNTPKWISNIYPRREYTAHDLPALLFSTNSSRASDPRDKVFALLGLIQDADRFGLIPDYSLTLEEVQIGMAAFFITYGDDCSILAYAKGVDESGADSDPRRFRSWAPTWDRGYRSTPVLRGSKKFGAYEILQSEHVASHVLQTQSWEILAKPRIHHIDGSLSILSLNLINLSRLTDSLVKYLNESTPSQISEFYPGFCLLLDTKTDVNRDSIVLFKGCETIFHIRKNPKRSESDTYQIIGVCNVLLSLDQPHRDQNVNISDTNIVSHFLLKICPMERKHLRRMIGLETLLKTLGCWDNTINPSPDVILSEIMFLDSIISQVFTAYIKGTSFDLTQSELENSDFKEKGTGNQPFFPTALQVQWLTTCLRFWDSQSSWEMVNALSDLYEGWLEWTVQRRIAFVGDKDIWDLESLEETLKGKARELADLTISLTGQLLRATGASYIKQCRVRIGKLHLLLLQPTSSGPVMSATALDIYDAIFQVLSENIAKAPKIPGSNQIIICSPLIRSSDWDWSELDFIFKPLNSFNSSDTRDLECVCSSRIFLRKLQPQVREWERITIF